MLTSKMYGMDNFKKKIFLTVIHMNAKCISSTKDYWSLYLIIQTPYAVLVVLFLDSFFVDTDHPASKQWYKGSVGWARLWPSIHTLASYKQPNCTIPGYLHAGRKAHYWQVTVFILRSHILVCAYVRKVPQTQKKTFSNFVRQKVAMSTACRCVSRHIPLSENIIRFSVLSTGCREEATLCMYMDGILNIYKHVQQRL